MNTWKEINEINLYYIKYNVVPNLVAFGLAYSYYNKITLDCSMDEYFNNVFALFNIVNINIKDQFKLVIIIKTDSIELIKIRK